MTPSPWPFLVASQIFITLIGFALYIHDYILGIPLFFFALIFVFFCLYRWWFDIIVESTFLGQHTKLIQKGLRYGMLLFILSEIMFFFSFFWAFFHSSVSPTIQIGAIWPPIGIHTIQPWGLPFFNTLLLLTSGIYASVAHFFIKVYGRQKYFPFFIENQIVIRINGATFITPAEGPFIKNNSFVRYLRHIENLTQKKLYKYITIGFVGAIFLGLFFTTIQLYEYIISEFSISDSIYGAVFYMATGFHGVHVIIGTIFLIVTFLRFRKGHFLGRFFCGVDASIWYWHFVDVIWIFLFIFIYWWGC